MNTPYRESKVCEKCVARERGSRWEFNSAWNTLGEGPKVSEAQWLVGATAIAVVGTWAGMWVLDGLGPIQRRLGLVALVLSAMALLGRVERKR